MIGLALAVSLLVVWVFEIGPLLSGKLPVTRAEPTPVKDEPDAGAAHIPFDGLLTDVKDGTPFGEVDRSYLHLLGLLERSEKEALPGKGRRVGYQKLLEAPSLYRGQSLRIAGLYVHSDPIRLDTPVSGREWVYRTWVVDPAGNEGWVVDLLERPAIELRSIVSVDGIFLKLAAYEGKKGPIQAPFLLGRQAVLVEKPR